MAYIPQYVPTDTNVLQNTLNQYQQAYDVNTAKEQGMSEAMAGIPASPTDEADKNSLMTGFSKEVDSLDKQFNFDRANSQYAQRLAALTTKYKAHPLWSFINDKAKAVDLRSKLIAEHGVNYHENFDPSSVTLKDANNLNNWKPGNLNDLDMRVASVAKEHATSISSNQPSITKLRDENGDPNGYLEIATQEGYRNSDEANKFLGSKKGQDWLSQHIQASGFDPNDLSIRDRAYSVAMSQLVGERKPSYVQDWSYRESIKNADKTGSNLDKIGNKGYQNSFFKQANVTDLSSAVKTFSQESLNKLGTQLDDPNIPEEKKAEIANQYQTGLYVQDKLRDVFTQVEAVPQNAKILKIGRNIIDNGLSGIETAPGNSDVVFNTIRDYMLKTSSLERKIQPVPETDFNKKFNAVLTPGVVSKTLNPVLKNLFTTFGNTNMTIPAIISGLVEGSSNATIAAIDNYKSTTNTKADLTRKLTVNLLKEYKANNSDKYSTLSEPQLTNLFGKTAKQVAKTIDEFENYYQGTGNYHETGANPNSFQVVKNQVDKKIKDGDVFVSDIYAPPYGSKPEEAKRATDWFGNYMQHFDVEDKNGNPGEWSPDRLKTFASKFNTTSKTGMAGGESTVEYNFTREGDPSITLYSPDKDFVTLRMNLAKMGPDFMDRASQVTGRPEFKDVIYKDITLSNRAQGYTINDNDQRLKNILSNRYQTLAPFNGVRVNRTTDLTSGTGRIKYILNVPGYPEPFEYATKQGLFGALDEVYLDYVKNKQ
jgi:hypothetical protein